MRATGERETLPDHVLRALSLLYTQATERSVRFSTRMSGQEALARRMIHEAQRVFERLRDKYGEQRYQMLKLGLGLYSPYSDA